MRIRDYGKILLGLTGNIASGKSLAIKFFDDKIFLRIDSDRLASRHLVENRDVIVVLKNKFGDEVFDSSNRIDRKKLSQIAFSDREVMKALEEVIHPLVLKDVEEMLKTSERKFVIVESAVLFESGLEGMFDRIITVFAPEELRVKRLMKRTGIDYDEAIRRIRFQMSEYLKVSRSDYVIDNSRGVVWLKRQVKRVEEDLKRLGES